MSDPEDIDALAAEYALGTLEREQATLRRARDPALDAATQSWEARLAPLGESIAELAPAPGLFSQIERQIDAPQESIQSAAVDLALRRHLKLWRAGALVAGAFGLRQETQAPPETFVAVRQKNAAAPGFLLSLDAANRTLAIRPIAASFKKGKSYELRLVAPKAAPRSFGVIDPLTTSIRTIPYNLRAAEDATWAVSLEPAGGSPTGPILFT